MKKHKNLSLNKIQGLIEHEAAGYIRNEAIKTPEIFSLRIINL